MEPLEVARLFQRKKAQIKRLESLKKKVTSRADALEAEVLQLIEDEKLPESFKIDGKPIFTREETWASALDGDHGRLADALASVGLVEYLPRTVNSHSLSAYIRGQVDEVTGEIHGVPQEVLDALKITKKTRVVATGL